MEVSVDNNQDLSSIIKSRRSVRVFDSSHPVERGKINAALDAARWAPSACNKQGWEFIVLDDRDIRKKIVDLSGRGKSSQQFIDTPVIIYCLYDKLLSPENNAHIQSASAAVQNLLLPLHSQGVGSCWYSDYHSELIRKHFKIAANMEVICGIRVGYAKEKNLKAPPRKSLKEVVSFNSYSSGPSSDDPNKLSFGQVGQVNSERIFTTSPKIGFVLPRKKEEEAIVNLILEEAKTIDDTLFIFSAPGEIVFPLLKSSDKIVNAIEFSSEIINWMRYRAEFINISNQQFNFHLWSDNCFREQCSKAKMIVLHEVLNKFSGQDREKFVDDLSKYINKGTKILILQTNPIYRLADFSIKSTKKSYMGAYEYLSKSYLIKLFEKHGLKNYYWLGIDLFPSFKGIRAVLRRKSKHSGKWKFLLKPALSILAKYDWGSLERFTTKGSLAGLTKLQGGIFQLK